MISGEEKVLLEKAKQSLDAAKILFKENFFDFSASRSYYAIFYSLEALLLSKDLSFSKHSAVISAFGKYFVKTGIFENKYHQFAIDAFDMRNLGDYGAMYSVEKYKAEELIGNSAELLEAIELYLSVE